MKPSAPLRSPDRPRPYEQAATRAASTPRTVWWIGGLGNLFLGCLSLFPVFFLLLSISGQLGLTYVAEENIAIGYLLSGVLGLVVLMIFLPGNLLLTWNSSIDRRRYWLVSTALLLAPSLAWLIASVSHSYFTL